MNGALVETGEGLFPGMRFDFDSMLQINFTSSPRKLYNLIINFISTIHMHV